MKTIRLNSIIIKNYKYIDELNVEFPHPLMRDDADILVFGSGNGIGKTSVLECCSLILLSGIIGDNDLYYKKYSNLLSSCIKLGEHETTIVGKFETELNSDYTTRITCKVSLIIDNKGFNKISIDGENFFKQYKIPTINEFQYLLKSILSVSDDIVIILPLLYFNSYRKGNDYCIVTDDNVLLDVLNNEHFIRFYEKMGLKWEISEYFSLINKQISCIFDYLSSGQKAYFSTLFLIGQSTLNRPSIVLIDEIELHLNAEWHSRLMYNLHKFFPYNQYIIATHSENVFNSVDENYRTILKRY